MSELFTMWFKRDGEVVGFELPDDPTDDDRALTLRLTKEFPRFLVPASEAGTDYMEPPTEATPVVEADTVTLYSPWFDAAGKP